MEEFITYIWGDNSYWSWWALAAFLFALEVFLPTFFLLWPGLAAVFVGLLAFFIDDWAWEYQVITFTVIAVIDTIIGRHYFAKRQHNSDHPTLNNPEKALVGRIVKVQDDFVKGYGAVEVGDSRWQAREQNKRNPKKDDMVEVVDVEGMTLIVK